MVTEREYQLARRVLIMCAILLVLSILFLGWTIYDYIKGHDEFHDLATSVINVALFTLLVIQNRKKIKEYQKQK